MRRKSGPRNSGPGSTKAQGVVAGMLEGKTMNQAAMDAGYAEGYAKTAFHSSPTAEWVKAEVDKRMNQAMLRSAIHTDAITGSLVEIMLASPADILPDHPVLAEARKNGVDHLIKKITFTPVKVGTEWTEDEEGKPVKTPIIRDKVDLEMYSRLDAISQLRDNFGMKQEPRANTYEETRRQEVEKSLERIMEVEGCDRPTAARMLKDALGDDSPLMPTVNKYVN